MNDIQAIVNHMVDLNLINNRIETGELDSAALYELEVEVGDIYDFLLTCDRDNILIVPATSLCDGVLAEIIRHTDLLLIKGA